MRRIGGLSLLGLSWPELLRAEARLASAPDKGQAKSVILLYLFGGPSVQETFDPKPEAPLEFRGEFGSTPTSVPGVHFCEYLPQMARWMNRSTLIGSASHDQNDHSAGLLYTMTGSPAAKLESLVPVLPSQAPSMNAVVEYLARHERRSAPASVWMPCYPGWGEKIERPGPFAGFLGPKYNPLITGCELRDTYEPKDFYDLRRQAVGRLLVPGTTLNPDIILERLQDRRSLADRFRERTDRLGKSDAYEQFDEYQQRAFDILSESSGPESPWRAFDLTGEKPSLRDRYGRHLYREAALTARRLVERGVRFVTVSWECFQKSGADPAGWDTHSRHFSILKDHRLPVLNQVYSALCEDHD